MHIMSTRSGTGSNLRQSSWIGDLPVVREISTTMSGYPLESLTPALRPHGPKGRIHANTFAA